MEVDIYIKELEGGEEIQVPWVPEEIGFAAGNARMATYDIMELGEVQIPNGRNLRHFKWDGILPGEGHSDLPFLRGDWKEPRYYQGLFFRWYSEGTPLRLLVTGTPINHDVYLFDYNVTYAGGHGDYSYNLDFVEKRDIVIGGTTTAAATTSTTSKSTTSSSASTSKTYTIKSGDTLWGIAQKELGSGAKYSSIYDLNKTIIEETAKKSGKSSSESGKWIFPGTVIKLP